MCDEYLNESLFFDVDQVREINRCLNYRLQYSAVTLLTRLQGSDALRLLPCRNLPSRCATQEFVALAGCSNCANWRINSRGASLNVGHENLTEFGTLLWYTKIQFRRGKSSNIRELEAADENPTLSAIGP